MKKGLKLISFLGMAILSVFLITGCNQKNKNVSGDLADIMDKLYQDIPSDKMPMVESIDITKENMEQYLGTNDLEYKEAIASEPLIGSIAHSVILIRTNANQDIEKMKADIKEKINPRKWICVWVEDEDVIIKNKGDLIIAIVVENKDIRETVSKNFDNL